jgi:multisubunit Na+/H+ antiporter MnhB subunit
MKHVLAVLAIVVGAAAVVFGGYDDSPGLQLIGGVIVLAALVLSLRAARRQA